MMKTALVFGSTGSLGKALIKKLLRRGFFVIGVSKSEDTLSHKNYRFILLDALNHENYPALLKVCDGMEIELIVNTIGLFSNKLLEELDFYEIEKIISTNFLIPVFLMKFVLSLPPSKKIITFIYLSSTSKNKIKERASLYASSKLAQSRFMDSVNLEIQEKRISCLEFCPGPFQSNIFQKGNSIIKEFDNSSLPTAGEIANILLDTYLGTKKGCISKLVLHRDIKGGNQ